MRICCIRDCKPGHSRLKKQCEQKYQTGKCGICPRNSRNFGSWAYLAGTQSTCRLKGRVGGLYFKDLCALRTRRLTDSGEVSRQWNFFEQIRRTMPSVDSFVIDVSYGMNRGQGY